MSKRNTRIATGGGMSPTIRGTQVKKVIYTNVKLGEIVQTPIEITITESWKSLWETAFLSTPPAYQDLKA